MDAEVEKVVERVEIELRHIRREVELKDELRECNQRLDKASNRISEWVADADSDERECEGSMLRDWLMDYVRETRNHANIEAAMKEHGVPEEHGSMYEVDYRTRGCLNTLAHVAGRSVEA